VALLRIVRIGDLARGSSTARELGAQGVQVTGPQVAELLYPAVDLAHARSLDGVQPSGTFRAHGGEAVLAQHAQMLGHRRLRDAELLPHDLDDLPGGAFTREQELEDAPPDRVAQDIERVHASVLSVLAYISNAENKEAIRIGEDHARCALIGS